ncbi:hypothetical protein BDC45DRAFT_555035 [Circinella umbellata]|nr:hypothetical protein BDC45DRAFT_555035 [Circinella umbellata]
MDFYQPIHITGMPNGLQYLKGCYMHWMQSVQRVSSIHAVVPNNNRNRFLELASNLRTIPTITDFDNNSNSVESFHNIFYTLIKGGQPLRKTIRQALKIAKSDQDDLSQFYKYANHYAQSDSRALDNTSAIFGDEKQSKNKNFKNKRQQYNNQLTPPRNKTMHSDGMGISFMEEPELPSLEVDDPAIQNELNSSGKKKKQWFSVACAHEDERNSFQLDTDGMLEIAKLIADLKHEEDQFVTAINEIEVKNNGSVMITENERIVCFRKKASLSEISTIICQKYFMDYDEDEDNLSFDLISQEFDSSTPKRSSTPQL